MTENSSYLTKLFYLHFRLRKKGFFFIIKSTTSDPSKFTLNELRMFFLLNFKAADIDAKNQLKII